MRLRDWVRWTLGILAAASCRPLARERVAPPPVRDTASGVAVGSPGVGGGDRLVGRPFATRSPVVATRGVAATAHPIASQVAVDILKRGGTAVDAAIAANAALGLMEPTGCGIGGDMFALVWDPKTERLHGFNGSGRSPGGRTLEALRAKLRPGARSIPPVGSLSVTVPGTVDGWFALHERFGRLPVAEILAPAIDYAEHGFGMTPLIAHYWALNFRRFDDAVRKSAPWLEEVDNARRTYLVGGRAPRAGEVFRNPDLAKTYRIIAEGGRAAFYDGPIAKTVDAYMKRIGGDLRATDFRTHRGTWVEPVTAAYRGYVVAEMPPNTQGLAALQMLQMLEGFDLARRGPGSAEGIHLIVEAKRLAFEDRARFYADPSMAEVPTAHLVSSDYATARRKLIDPSQARVSVTAGAPALDAGDTTYLTVADASGMMVSLIQSNYRGMGSGLVPDGLGFMLQDRGELFALEPGHRNVYAPGKRPFHTIIPAFVLKDGEPWLSFGVMGGAMQPQGHVQILVNMIDHGMNVQEAGDAARFRHDGSSEPTGESGRGVGTIRVEEGISPGTRAGLEARGHRVQVGTGGFGGYQAIRWDAATRTYRAASEMRKDGAAIGY